MNHYVFEDNDTGEEFIVGADNVKEAVELAKTWFVDPSYICEFTDEEAEASGLNEY